MKDFLELDSVAQIGRTFEEQSTYFSFNRLSLKDHKVLDVTAGVSSSHAKANDPVYDFVAADLVYFVLSSSIANFS